SRRRHTRWPRDWSSDVCSSDLAENKLFATLDPTTRRLRLPTNQNVLLSDTVGFIRKLPHRLIEAFKATLEEVVQADLLLHVVDRSEERRVGKECRSRWWRYKWR